MVGFYFELCRGHSDDSGHSEVWVFPNVDHNEVHRRVGGATRPKQQGREWFTHPTVRGQALPGGSDAAWIVLVYRATDPRSRFEMLIESFTVEQPSPGESPKLARVTLR